MNYQECLSDVEVKLIQSPPHSYTFKSKKVKTVVENHLEGRTLNLFAGKVKLNHDQEIVRNDIREEMPADCHFDATKVSEHVEPNSFDTVILDPPYSLRKSREYYEDTYKGKFTHIKDQVKDIVRTGGIVITLGYSSVGMSESRGFKKQIIYAIEHKGDHDNTWMSVESKEEGEEKDNPRKNKCLNVERKVQKSIENYTQK